MTGPRPSPSARAAVALAAVAAVVAGLALVRDLTGGGVGALRAVFAAVAGLAALACLLAARQESGALVWMLAALGATLAAGAAAALA
jgi:hypothetical protein